MQFIHAASSQLSATYLLENSPCLENGSRWVSLGGKFSLENTVHCLGTRATEISRLPSGHVHPLASFLSQPPKKVSREAPGG